MHAPRTNTNPSVRGGGSRSSTRLHPPDDAERFRRFVLALLPLTAADRRGAVLCAGAGRPAPGRSHGPKGCAGVDASGGRAVIHRVLIRDDLGPLLTPVVPAATRSLAAARPTQPTRRVQRTAPASSASGRASPGRQRRTRTPSTA
jgi:hypothetical protein